jgi:hypothetical protein
MAVPRRQRKLRFLRSGVSLGTVLVAILPVSLAVAEPIRAVTSELVVIDPNSGLAIDGFDPVAYFTDGAPLPGKGSFEQVVGGAPWRFRNAGNRAAFVANPEVYMPRFGGHDPIAIARGVAVPGNPLLWVIAGERLYFFYTPQARDQFAADPDRAVAAADLQWSAVSRTLVP